MSQQIIDISIPVHPEMAIYPGDQPTVFDPIIKPSGSRLTKITIGSHAGTHTDAPSHSIAGDRHGVDVYSLDTFYGPCRVIEIMGNSIDQDELTPHDIKPSERILFKTSNSARGYNQFYDDWVALTSDGAEYLADIGVGLVGIGWFGIKQEGAPDNRAHTALLEKQIPILEALDLSSVEAGLYTLVAFPVAYQAIDGAPTRAILISNQ